LPEVSLQVLEFLSILSLLMNNAYLLIKVSYLMKNSRRSFLKTSGLIATGFVAAGSPLLSFCGPASRNQVPFGIQLFTLRDVIGDDPEGVLRQLAGFGYTQIESYEGPQGMFWGMGNTGFKQLMDELGMTIISSHANVFEGLEQKVEEAADIGMEYLVCPWIGPQDSLDDYKEMADRFNEIGQVVRNGGVKFAYHNHAYTFEEMEGEIPQAVLMDGTDPDLVEFQMDIYWVVAGGADPEEWIRMYPNRFTSSHVKDLVNGDEPESTIIGTGTIDFPPLLRLAREYGMKYFIVEQEAYTNTTPIDAVRENSEYMKNLRL
jgi:sugar phosphate isomerase/epimerase